MAVKVRIEAELDPSGALTGLRVIEGQGQKSSVALQKVGQQGNVVFTGLTQQQKRAADAAQLLGNTIGVQLPRQIQKLIAQSESLSRVLSFAFNATVMVGFAGALAALIPKVREYARELGGYGEEIRKIHNSNLEANKERALSPDSLSTARKELGLLNEQARQREWIVKLLEKEDDEIGLIFGYVQELRKAEVELRQIEQDRIKLLERITELTDKQRQNLMGVAGEVGMIGLKGFAAIAEQQRQARLEIDRLRSSGAMSGSLAGEAELLIDERARRQRAELERQAANETIALRQRVTEIGLKGVALIMAKERAAKQDLDRLLAETLISRKQHAERAALIEQQRIKEVAELLRQYTADTHAFVAQSSAATAKGFEAVEAQARRAAEEARRAFREMFGGLPAGHPDRVRAEEQLQARLVAIDAEANERRVELRREMTDRITALEQDAAIAALPEWMRGQAEIVASYQDATRRIQQELADRVISEANAARLVDAEWRRMNARLVDEHRRMTQELASQFESVFDDMTSGNLGKRILQGFKRMFFQVLASWVSTMRGVRAGGAGGFGGILGGVLFGGGAPGGVFGGMGTPPFVPAGGAALGSASPATSSFSLDQFPVQMRTPGNSLLAAGSAFFRDGAIVAGSSTGSSGRGGLRGFIGANRGALAGLLPMLAMAGGQKIGGTAGMLGAAVSSLGVLGAMNPALLGPLAMIPPAIFAGIGGGLLGFGVGMQHGKVAGSVTGAAAGLGTAGLMSLLGLSLGPVGWIAAGVIGLLGGLFGGIFGGRKRKRQAQKLSREFGTEIQRVIDSYRGFQTDYASALQALEQMRTDAWEQMRKLKGEGKKEFSRTLEPKFADARRQIEMIEAERQRRAGLLFGLPQFHSGGFVSGQMAGFRMRNGDIVARLREGEFVATPEATARNRGALEAMNNGGKLGGETHVHIHAVDAQSFEGWLKRGGMATIERVVRQRRQEGM